MLEYKLDSPEMDDDEKIYEDLLSRYEKAYEEMLHNEFDNEELDELMRWGIL